MIIQPIMILWGITDLDLPIPSFKEEVESQTGFRITREQMILHGICPNCQKPESK